MEAIAKECGIVEKAIKQESDGDEDDAIKEWEKIFNPESEGDKNISSAATPTVINRVPHKPWCNV